jgi:hypothetical protein
MFCGLREPNYDDLSIEDKKIFCRLVYLLRKRYSIKEAQEVSLRKILDDSIPYNLAK